MCMNLEREQWPDSAVRARCAYRADVAERAAPDVAHEYELAQASHSTTVTLRC